jgi:hypothetical protein
MILNEHFIEEYLVLALQTAHVPGLLDSDRQTVNDRIDQGRWLAGFQLPSLTLSDLEEVPRLQLQKEFLSQVGRRSYDKDT